MLFANDAISFDQLSPGVNLVDDKNPSWSQIHTNGIALFEI